MGYGILMITNDNRIHHMGMESLQDPEQELQVESAEGLEAAEEGLAAKAQTIENPLKRRLAITFMSLVSAITAGCQVQGPDMRTLPGKIEGTIARMNAQARRDAEYRAGAPLAPTRANITLEVNQAGKARMTETWQNRRQPEPGDHLKHKK